MTNNDEKDQKEQDENIFLDIEKASEDFQKDEPLLSNIEATAIKDIEAINLKFLQDIEELDRDFEDSLKKE